MYVVNMFYCHWLMNKESGLACDRVEQSQAGKTKLNAGRKKMESVRSHVAPLETDTGTWPGKPQPHGNTQINRDGLI